jgi:hypothetical protein
MKDLGLNPRRVINTERSMCSLGLGTEYFPWIFGITSTSNQSSKPPSLKISELLQKARSPEELIFQEPETPTDMFAIQSHVACSSDLCTFLSATKEALDEVPG